MSDDADLDPLRRIIERFVSRAREEFEERIRRWPTDLSQQEVHEVVGALLARQVALASELAGSPGIWTANVAPIVLRAMADVYINLIWILKDPLDRSRKFILYGLGQAKLQLEHRKARMAGAGEAEPNEERFVRALEEWITNQRYIFLIDVNLGSWSGITTRKMAEEAGCLGFYNYVYTPLSACGHSMWQYVSIHNLKECRNPLHRLHLVPVVSELAPSLEYLCRSAEHLQMTFAIFDTAFGISPAVQPAFDILCQDLTSFGGTEVATPDEQSTTNSDRGESTEEALPI